MHGTHHLAPLKPKSLELIHMRLLEPRDSDLVPYGLRRPTGFPLLFRIRAARIDMRPVASGIVEAAFAGGVVLRHLSVLRVRGFGGAKEGLERDEGGLEGEDGGPCVFEDVETYGAGGGGDVRMIDLSDELHLDGLKGV